MSPQRSILISVILFVVTRVCSAQAPVNPANYDNSDLSPTATSNGRYFVDVGSGLELVNANLPSMAAFERVNISLFGGLTLDSLSPVASITDGSFANEALYFGNDYAGVFFDLSAGEYTVVGVPQNGYGFLRQFVWTGTAPTYADAMASGTAYVASSSWNQLLGGGGVPAATFTGMPATIFTIPEPSSFALFGLGALALLIRRNSNQKSSNPSPCHRSDPF